jgi:hypothetical protein
MYRNHASISKWFPCLELKALTSGSMALFAKTLFYYGATLVPGVPGDNRNKWQGQGKSGKGGKVGKGVDKGRDKGGSNVGDGGEGKRHFTLGA